MQQCQGAKALERARTALTQAIVARKVNAKLFVIKEGQIGLDHALCVGDRSLPGLGCVLLIPHISAPAKSFLEVDP